MSDSDQTTDTHGEEIVDRRLDPDRENPGVQIAEIVAELEGEDPADLTTMYGCIDGVIEHVFSDPPSQEAQLVVEFTYEGYRITIEQDGSVRFVKVG
ncbi:HalOD1 output domain-containing protein [Natronoarchaeum mannanilyticum]|uniref:Halobacterial output domain-containing protein n=1 Tax=Natronoarchaeum mannanilyticum TaxID=926360 RepID=A0AAV3T983_9EURY